MSFSDDEQMDLAPVKRTRSRSPSPRPVASRASNDTSNSGVIAGVVLAGVGIAAAVGARILLQKKPTPVPSRKTASTRSETRRRVPPRRPRSVASGTSSAQHSPTSSVANTPKKAQKTAVPSLPARRPRPAAGGASAPASSSTGAAVKLAGAAAVAAGATAAAVAAATSSSPHAAAAAAASLNKEAAEEETTISEFTVLKQIAEEAVEQTEAAAASGDADATAHAVEALEDAVDSQIALAKEEAVEAVAGLVEAAADAEEAAADAESVLQHVNDDAEAVAAKDEGAVKIRGGVTAAVAAVASAAVLAAGGGGGEEVDAGAEAILLEGSSGGEVEGAAAEVASEQQVETTASAAAATTVAAAAVAAAAAAAAASVVVEEEQAAEVVVVEEKEEEVAAAAVAAVEEEEEEAVVAAPDVETPAVVVDEVVVVEKEEEAAAPEPEPVLAVEVNKDEVAPIETPPETTTEKKDTTAPTTTTPPTSTTTTTEGGNSSRVVEKPKSETTNGSTAAAPTDTDADADDAAPVAPLPVELPTIEAVLDEEDGLFETLDAIPHPVLNFDEAPPVNEPLSPLEEKVRQMALAAHKHIKDNQNKIVQATKEQSAALDLALGPEGTGKIRPSLIAACSFALADMLVAQRKLSETKVSLATAYDAAQRVENKGAAVRALMNYAYVLRMDNKPRSTRATYSTALEIAKNEYGPSHPSVEQVKTEFVGFLAKSGRVEEGATLLVECAAELEETAEKLENEGPPTVEETAAAAETAASKEEGGESAGVADPGTGLEHIAAADGGEEAQGGEVMTPHAQARHFAMRNLMNASALLDALGRFEEGEAALQKAMVAATEIHGENSAPHMNAIYALGMHYRRQGRVQDSIHALETVLSIMDETIEVYEPDVLRTRVQILRDTAVLYDEMGEATTAVDYATGALVNAQTLARIMAQMPGAPPAAAGGMLEPFWNLLADLREKSGDKEGAAEARREALKGRVKQTMANRGGRTAQRSGSSGKRSAAASGGSTRAGGRRV